MQYLIIRINSWILEYLTFAFVNILEISHNKNIININITHTLASLETVGLLGNWTSVAFKIVFSSRIVAWDWLCPNGFLPYKHW